MNNDTPPDLSTLRAEIDQIDTALHDLLMRRADTVARMASGRAKGSGPTFRPGREAQILRRLFARHQGPMPRTAILRFWRDLIASSLAQQGNFLVATYGAETEVYARQHFGLLAPTRIYHTPARALGAVSSGEATVAVLPWPQEGEAPDMAWWPQLDAPRLQVVAGLPFLQPRGNTAPEALVVGPMSADASGKDRSLLRFEHPEDYSRARIAGALSSAGLTPRHLLQFAGPVPMALVETDGAVEPDDPRLALLPFERLTRLGVYAEPEPESDAP
ncbi:chorismate mutase [Acetobacteraceae bacterium H6797]|nr:chorismate mutase [Acetobacteraceae bacterium H6797]